jgi:hypothetical protein
MENGTIDYANAAYVSLIGFPFVKYHYLYGDMSGRRDEGQLLLGDLVKALGTLVFSGEEVHVAEVTDSATA